MYLNNGEEEIFKILADRLTVTLDVFKYDYKEKTFKKDKRLTVTLDVFK